MVPAPPRLLTGAQRPRRVPYRTERFGTNRARECRVLASTSRARVPGRGAPAPPASGRGQVCSPHGHQHPQPPPALVAPLTWCHRPALSSSPARRTAARLPAPSRVRTPLAAPPQTRFRSPRYRQGSDPAVGELPRTRVRTIPQPARFEPRLVSWAEPGSESCRYRQGSNPGWQGRTRVRKLRLPARFEPRLVSWAEPGSESCGYRQGSNPGWWAGRTRVRKLRLPARFEPRLVGWAEPGSESCGYRQGSNPGWCAGPNPGPKVAVTGKVRTPVGGLGRTRVRKLRLPARFRPRWGVPGPNLGPKLRLLAGFGPGLRGWSGVGAPGGCWQAAFRRLVGSSRCDGPRRGRRRGRRGGSGRR